VDGERSGRERLASAVAVALFLALVAGTAVLVYRHEHARRMRARRSYRLLPPAASEEARQPKEDEVPWQRSGFDTPDGPGFGGWDGNGDFFYARFDARGLRWLLFQIDVTWEGLHTEGHGNFFTLPPPRPGGEFIDVADETSDLVRVVSRDGYFPCPVDATPDELAAFARDLVSGPESVEHALVRLAKAKSWDDLRARLAARLREGG
jgi:hypothetical protein